jgi:hypothetical protein
VRGRGKGVEGRADGERGQDKLVALPSRRSPFEPSARQASLARWPAASAAVGSTGGRERRERKEGGQQQFDCKFSPNFFIGT